MSAHSVSPTSKTSPQFYHISALLPSPLPCPNWQHLSPGGHQQPPRLSLGFPLAPRQQGALVLSDDLILRSKPSNGFPAGLAHPPFAYLALQEPARVTTGTSPGHSIWPHRPPRLLRYAMTLILPAAGLLLTDTAGLHTLRPHFLWVSDKCNLLREALLSLPLRRFAFLHST